MHKQLKPTLIHLKKYYFHIRIIVKLTRGSIMKLYNVFVYTPKLWMGRVWIGAYPPTTGASGANSQPTLTTDKVRLTTWPQPPHHSRLHSTAHIPVRASWVWKTPAVFMVYMTTRDTDEKGDEPTMHPSTLMAILNVTQEQQFKLLK